MISRPTRTGLFAAAGIIALSACGDSSTQPGTPPTTMIPISMPTDTIETGGTTDPPLAVRIEDAMGNAVEGTPVRFFVVNGQGALSPGVAVAGSDGIAESRFRAAATPGTARIRADIPSAPNVPAFEFTVVTQASDSVTLSVVEGSGQRAEVGSQLPIPFVVEVRTPQGDPAGGISVAYRITTGESAVLTADSVITSADGRASSLLTLGRASGEYTVTAFATRGVQTDSVRFTATATATFEGSVVVDSVSGGELTAGQQAVLHGSGFSPVAAENDVRIEGVTAQVLDASGSRLTVLVPTYSGECLPAREVGLRVLVQGDASNGSMIHLNPVQPFVDLAIGETMTVRGPEAVSCLQFGPGDAPREFGVIVASADRRAGQSVDMRLRTRIPADLGASTSVSPLILPDMEPALAQEVTSRARQDVTLRRNVLRGLTEGRARVARASVAPQPASISVPTVGESLQYFFAVRSDLTATCDNTDVVVTGTVRAVGEHLVLLEDDNAPRGGFGPDEWSTLLAELDQVIAPVDAQYFGPWEDIDANGRVVILFSPLVNALSSGDEAGIGGFFLPLDLAASGAGGGGLPGPGGELCPASNEAEILYLATADPEGLTGPAIPVDRAVRNARGLTAHELQHLINAERRIANGAGGFGDAEEVWLDEGLSGLAEGFAGLAVIGQSTRSGLTYDQVTGTRSELDAFNSFQINNFFNLSLFMFSPASAPTIAGVDFGGLGGLQMRGFSWFLLRWLADQATAGEEAFLRDIVVGGQNLDRGIENLERATGRFWEDLLADFAVAIVTDGTGQEGLDERFRILTWEQRDVFARLNRNVAAGSLFPLPFPLRAAPLAAETAAFDFNVGASTVSYFTLAPGTDVPALALGVFTPTGDSLSESSEPQITIVRIK
jgi:hypothetical protein